MNIVELLIYAAAWEIVFRKRWSLCAERSPEFLAACDYLEACHGG